MEQTKYVIYKYRTDATEEDLGIHAWNKVSNVPPTFWDTRNWDYDPAEEIARFDTFEEAKAYFAKECIPDIFQYQHKRVLDVIEYTINKTTFEVDGDWEDLIEDEQVFETDLTKTVRAYFYDKYYEDAVTEDSEDDSFDYVEAYELLQKDEDEFLEDAKNHLESHVKGINGTELYDYDYEDFDYTNSFDHKKAYELLVNDKEEFLKQAKNHIINHLYMLGFID